MTVRIPPSTDFIQNGASMFKDPLTGSTHRIVQRNLLPWFSPVNGVVAGNYLFAQKMELNVNVCLDNGQRHAIQRIVLKSFVANAEIPTSSGSRAKVVNHPQIAPTGSIIWTSQDYLDTLAAMVAFWTGRGLNPRP